MRQKEAWANPSAWALEEAGRQVLGASDEVRPPDVESMRQSDSAEDDGASEASQPEEQEYKWEEKPAIGGRRNNFSFETEGAVKIGLHSATFGADGLRFYARWSEIDEKGNVVQELWSSETWESKDPRRNEHGGNILFNASKDITLKPPFESGSGRYRVDIVVPPNPTYNGNSAGVDINIFPQQGRRVTELK
ncbi:hypothetical protein KAJ83_17080 [Marivibrio halodurans]|uniref:Uncharacterized protein n=1 Tax=Marivibrio halodurans TaxID=2039722 RepID=A0A8J7V2E1_9PROT|nr:hypothetical protein [Marivibrio halodurans]MBP5858736.1 hypothetical protein [Marivibrio halodurans]